MAEQVQQLRSELGNMDKAAAARRLNEHTAECASRCTREYKQLGDYLFVRFLDGNIKGVDDEGQFRRTEHGVAAGLKYGGYDERYYRAIANDPDGGERLKELIIQ